MLDENLCLNQNFILWYAKCFKQIFYGMLDENLCLNQILFYGMQTVLNKYLYIFLF